MWNSYPNGMFIPTFIKTRKPTSPNSAHGSAAPSFNKPASRKLASRRPTCPESYNASRSVLTTRDPFLSLESARTANGSPVCGCGSSICTASRHRTP